MLTKLRTALYAALGVVSAYSSSALCASAVQHADAKPSLNLTCLLGEHNSGQFRICSPSHGRHYTEIRRYTFEGSAYYLGVPDCCGQLKDLYDHNGALLCSPSGGFAGHGGLRCPADVRKILRSQNEAIWPKPTPKK
jgi:hypothetical protein